MLTNEVGRLLPEQVGDYRVRPYAGLGGMRPAAGTVHTARRQALRRPGASKLCADLKEAIQGSGLRSGMTISFHHSFREGDMVLGQVLSVVRELGIRGLKLAPSAVVNPCGVSLAGFVADGTVDRIEASGIRGELGDGIVDGTLTLAQPVILRPHGGRPRAIEAGELTVDVAFIAVSAADEYGNCTGRTGQHPCGSLGYSFIDAHSAGCVVAVTDTLVDYPCCPASISQQYIDYVVKVDRVGDPQAIGAGAARLTKNPRDLMIARQVADVIAASRRFISS